MRRFLRVCLLSSASEQPTTPMKLRKHQEAGVLYEGIRKWGKVVSNLPH